MAAAGEAAVFAGAAVAGVDMVGRKEERREKWEIREEKKRGRRMTRWAKTMGGITPPPVIQVGGKGGKGKARTMKGLRPSKYMKSMGRGRSLISMYRERNQTHQRPAVGVVPSETSE